MKTFNLNIFNVPKFNMPKSPAKFNACNSVLTSRDHKEEQSILDRCQAMRAGIRASLVGSFFLDTNVNSKKQFTQ